MLADQQMTLMTSTNVFQQVCERGETTSTNMSVREGTDVFQHVCESGDIQLVTSNKLLQFTTMDVEKGSYGEHVVKYHSEYCDGRNHWILCINPGPWEISQNLSLPCVLGAVCDLNALEYHKYYHHKEVCDGKTHTYNVCMLQDDVVGCDQPVKVACDTECKVVQQSN